MIFSENPGRLPRAPKYPATVAGITWIRTWSWTPGVGVRGHTSCWPPG